MSILPYEILRILHLERIKRNAMMVKTLHVLFKPEYQLLRCTISIQKIKERLR